MLLPESSISSSLSDIAVSSASVLLPESSISSSHSDIAVSSASVLLPESLISSSHSDMAVSSASMILTGSSISLSDRVVSSASMLLPGSSISSSLSDRVVSSASMQLAGSCNGASISSSGDAGSTPRKPSSAKLLGFGDMASDRFTASSIVCSSPSPSSSSISTLSLRTAERSIAGSCNGAPISSTGDAGSTPRKPSPAKSLGFGDMASDRFIASSIVCSSPSPSCSSISNPSLSTAERS